MNYSSGPAFREAVEQRILTAAVGKPPTYVLRLRRLIVIERFLARLQVNAPGLWLLKGGVALDFRFGDRARTTRDVDLESVADEDEIVGFVAGASEVTLDDFFSFVVERTRQIIVDGEQRAIRFRIIGLLGGRRFETVIMDVGLAGVSADAVDLVPGTEFLTFAGIAPLQIRTLSLAQHLAEKLHAYSRIYAEGRPSSRVKDLADIVLIVTEQKLEAEEVLDRIAATFGGRDTHSVAESIPEPPDAWRLPYRDMATEIGLDPDVNVGYRIAAAFFDPLLSCEAKGGAVWSPDLREWHSPSRRQNTIR